MTDGQVSDEALRAALATVLTLDGIRQRYGWTAATVRQYRTAGVLPEPDAVFGRTPVWLPGTLDAWERTRPGQGAGGGRRTS